MKGLITHPETGKEINVLNMTTTNNLDSYKELWLDYEIFGSRMIMVNTEQYEYGGEKKHDAISAHKFTFLKFVNSLNLSKEQRNELLSHVDTINNQIFRDGQREGAEWERKCAKDKNLIPY